MTHHLQTIHDFIRNKMIEEVEAQFVGGSSGLDDMARQIASDHVDACIRVLAKCSASQHPDKIFDTLAKALAFLDHLGTPHSEPLNSLNGGLVKACRNRVTAELRSDARQIAEEIRASLKSALAEEEEKRSSGEPRGGGEDCK